MNPTRQEIEDYILGKLQELCRDWDYSKPVSSKSFLFRELGLESLDAVVLGTSIQEHFGRPLPFAELFSEIGRLQRDLSIEELADFVNKHLSDVNLETTPMGRLQ